VNSRACILGNRLQLVLERLDLPLADVADRLFLSERAEGVQDRDEDVVVLTARLHRRIGDVRELLIAAGGEEGTAEEVVGPLAVALALDGLPHAARRLLVLGIGVQDPGLRLEHLGSCGRRAMALREAALARSSQMGSRA